MVTTRVTDLFAVRKPRVVGPITVGHGANEFFAIAIPPIIPLLVSDFGISYAQAGFLLTTFFIMYSIFQLPAGVLADWLGKRRLLIMGLAGMSVGIFLASTAQSYGMLLVAQAIAGISGSTFHPTGMSIISDVETTVTEGKAMGVFGFGGAIGTLLSPVIIGGLAAVAGWRIALAAAAVLGVGATVTFILLFRETREDVHSGDSGTSLSIKEKIKNSIQGLLYIPRTRSIVLLFFITLTLSLQHRAIHTFTTSYIVAETGVSVSFGNFVFFILLVGASLSSLWIGDLADRMNRTRLGGLTSIGTALFVGSTVFVALVFTDFPVWLTIVAFTVWFFILGVLMYGAYPVKNAIISNHAEAGYSATMFGVMQTASAIGSGAGPAIFGILSTEYGVVSAFPAIALVSLLLAFLFFLLSK